MRGLIWVLLLIPAVVFSDRPQKGEVIWENRAGVSFLLTGGNSEWIDIRTHLKLNRNTYWINEWTLEFLLGYSASSSEILETEAEGSLRFGWSITESLYNFYRLSVYHSHKLQLSLRWMPTTGVGFWFSDTDVLKSLIEAGLGYKYGTYYNAQTLSEWILQSRFFLEWQIVGGVFWGNNTFYYPSLDNHQVDSETYLKMEIDRLAFRLSCLLNYNSLTRVGVKNLDYAIRSGLDWRF